MGNPKTVDLEDSSALRLVAGSWTDAARETPKPHNWLRDTAGRGRSLRLVGVFSSIRVSPPALKPDAGGDTRATPKTD